MEIGTYKLKEYPLCTTVRVIVRIGSEYKIFEGKVVEKVTNSKLYVPTIVLELLNGQKVRIPMSKVIVPKLN